MAIFTENVFMDILAIAVSFLLVFIAYFKWLLTFWERRGVYTLPPSIPFGNGADLFWQKQNMGEELETVYNDIKSRGRRYGGWYFFGKPIFVPVDLDLIKRILITDFAHFTDHVNHVDEDIDSLTTHLFNLKGSKWRNLRTKLSPTFTSGKMKMMFNTLVNCSKGLIGVMDDVFTKNDIIDIKDLAGRYTTDVIGSCAFGIECNSLKNPHSEFRTYGKKVFGTSLAMSVVRLLTFVSPELLGLLRLRTFGKDVNDFFTDIVKQTVTFREENNVIREDFMHLLIQLKNNVKIVETETGCLKNDTEAKQSVRKIGTGLTLTEITAQAFVFFAAGFETSSTAITFCLYELSQNPELQDKVREEINTVLDKHGGELTYDGIMEMTYMGKCINETLRKYPPLPVHTRECTQTYKVPDSDLILEKGSFVFIPALGIQHDPEYYPDPEKFDPDRFTEENKAALNLVTWIPFGSGPRLCIGSRFAFMQVKSFLAVVLKEYIFSLNCKTKTPITLDPRTFILSPKDTVWLNVERI